MEEKELTEKQERFINEYLVSKNMTECCKNLGISRNTGYNYLKDESIKREIGERRNLLLKDTSIYMQNSLREASEYLVEIISDETILPNIRISAINCLFNNSIKITEQVDILERLSLIEDNIKEQKEN